MALKWNFQRGGGGISSQKAFHGRGMNIFWNNTIMLWVDVFFLSIFHTSMLL